MDPSTRGVVTYGTDSCAPETELEAASSTDSWMDFFQSYESFLTCELASQHPQFTRALRQLERETCLEQERQSAQVLATLRLKDSKIATLQRIVREQREQLDVVLDEFERRETKEDKEVQVDAQRPRQDVSVQTVRAEKALRGQATQTEIVQAEDGAMRLLKKLESELVTLEQRNVALEKELQLRIPTNDETEHDEAVARCLDVLQQGVDAIEFSSSCVATPFSLFIGGTEGESQCEDTKEFATESTCVNLEHRLEAQRVQLEHLQECLRLCRKAAIRFIKRQRTLKDGSESSIPSFSSSLIVRTGDSKEIGAVNCSLALRGALNQLRQYLFETRGRGYEAKEQFLKDLAVTLARSTNGPKTAAKMVQTWAGWESNHLDEVRALRQSFAEERAVHSSQRSALLKRIAHLEQRQFQLQVEVNTLRKKCKSIESDKDLTPCPASRRYKEEGEKWTRDFEYPELMLRLATVEQSLLVKDEQLSAANATIKALSSYPPGAVKYDTLVARSDDVMNSLAFELQSVSKPRLDLLQSQEKNLISMSQYFAMEKLCLQLQARVEIERKQVALIKAAKEVCEQERDELLRKFDKLEAETLMAKITHESTVTALEADHVRQKPRNCELLYALKRLRLMESDRIALRDRLQQAQEQVALMKHQLSSATNDEAVEIPTLKTSSLDGVVEFHQQCVSEFQKFHDRQRGEDEGASTTLQDSQTEKDTTRQSPVEWRVLFTQYQALWIAFNFLHSSVRHLLSCLFKNGMSSVIAPECASLLAAFHYQVSASCTDSSPPQTVEFELLKRDEAIRLLQQRVLDQEEQLIRYKWASDTDELNAVTSDWTPSSDDKCELREDATNPSINKLMNEAGRSFLAAVKPHTTIAKPHTIPSKKPDDFKTTAEHFEATRADTASAMGELENCLAKCAYLTSQNFKLTRHLQVEKATKEKCIQDLRLQLSEKERLTLNGRDCKEEGDGRRHWTHKLEEPRQEQVETLREQLASREQENLALVQSLCTIKEKCAHMEATHEKELRGKATKHAENLQSSMATITATLSRLESEKTLLNEENDKLSTKVQELECASAQQRLKQSQQSSKSTNTELAPQALELQDFMEEKKGLETRIEDLELQVANERKLVQVAAQKHALELQQEKLDIARVKQDFEALQTWRDKLQEEFIDYQSVQQTFQEESGKRIDFLATCIEEFIRLADATPASNAGKLVSTSTLYDTVMKLAREGPERAENGAPQHQQQQKRGSTASRRQQSSVKTTSAERHEAWNALLVEGMEDHAQSEINEALWWQLRASKLETHVRSRLYENDTFEDTIRQLELRMNHVKEELSMRLAHEVQLEVTITALRSELASTKEQAASLADKYQAVSAELEKNQGEVTSRSNEMLRVRMAVQRKTELLTQQKAKIAALQQEQEQAAKRLERLATVEKQAALLQQKAKSHTQQLLHARQTYERCHDDNVELSLHLEKMKERHAEVLARLKGARAEAARLRSQLENTAKADENGQRVAGSKEQRRSNQEEGNAGSIASLVEETRLLKRRVLQKQDVIVSYKAKVTEQEAQLERQRETMVKLARTNRDLQQGQRQRQQEEEDLTGAIHTKLEERLHAKQDEFDGLRASVYDSLEAFVFCQPSPPITRAKTLASSSCESLVSDEDIDDLFAFKRWTEFSAHDLEELNLAQAASRPQYKRERQDNDSERHKAAIGALRGVEGALELNPEDCRAELCNLLECLCR